ncbi:MAG: hypothetical protein J6A56_05265, partial [Clostridia bacterium]|nr:hypothetical protein [Clostridia bacterium]
MSRKAQFMKSLISIYAARQFIEFALQTYSTISKNVCLQRHFYAAVNIAGCTQYIIDKVVKTCGARLTAFIIPYSTKK